MSQEIRSRDSARRVKIASTIAVFAGMATAWMLYDMVFFRIIGGVLFCGGLIAFIVGRFME